MPETKEGKNPDFSPPQIVDDLKELHGEFTQLSELEQTERSYVENLVETLKFLLSEIDAAVPINPEVLRQIGIKNAYLVSDAVIFTIDEKDNITSHLLTKSPSNIILAVIQDCSPKLRKLITERKQLVSERVGLLERIMRELKKTKAVLKPTKQDLEEMDIVRSSITTE